MWEDAYTFLYALAATIDFCDAHVDYVIVTARRGAAMSCVIGQRTFCIVAPFRHMTHARNLSTRRRAWPSCANISEFFNIGSSAGRNLHWEFNIGHFSNTPKYKTGPTCLSQAFFSCTAIFLLAKSRVSAPFTREIIITRVTEHV